MCYQSNGSPRTAFDLQSRFDSIQRVLHRLRNEFGKVSDGIIRWIHTVMSGLDLDNVLINRFIFYFSLQRS